MAQKSGMKRLWPVYQHAEPTTVELKGLGELRGLNLDNRVLRFLNVPYAQPPVGELRFRRPRPVQPWRGALDCSTFGPLCPQPVYTSMADSEGVEYSEDCLKLNIWVPAGSPPSGGWPVVIWFHGGWLQMGNASVEEGQDPTELIAADSGNLGAIWVSVAYRLSILGFIAGRELQAESGDGSAGNMGLWDQRMAIEWVHHHIAAFGGNPSNVTLAGRSAGAFSAEAQAAHDFFYGQQGRDNLFRRLAMYSNAISADLKTVGEVQAQFDEVVAACSIPSSASGAEKLARLRAIPSAALIDVVMKLQHHTFRAVADDVFLPTDLMARFQRGDFAREFRRRDLRLLIGEVKNEETLYRVTNAPKSDEDLARQVGNYYAGHVFDQLVALYRSGIHLSVRHPDPDPDVAPLVELFGDVIADGQIRAPSRLLVRQLRDAGVPLSHVHRYRIDWIPDVARKAYPAKMGVSHAFEKPLHNFSVFYGVSESERAVMKQWVDSLAAFVAGKKLDYGTRDWQEVKVLTEQGTIEVQQDDKWAYLQKVAAVMAAPRTKR